MLLDLSSTIATCQEARGSLGVKTERCQCTEQASQRHRGLVKSTYSSIQQAILPINGASATTTSRQVHTNGSLSVVHLDMRRRVSEDGRQLVRLDGRAIIRLSPCRVLVTTTYGLALSFREPQVNSFK